MKSFISLRIIYQTSVCNHLVDDELINREFIKNSVRTTLNALLGETCLAALEFHLSNILERDPYDVFCDSPRNFYEALQSIFGQGADKVLEVIFSTLAQKGLIKWVNPAQAVELLKAGDEASRIELLKLFKSTKVSEK